MLYGIRKIRAAVFHRAVTDKVLVDWGLKVLVDWGLISFVVFCPRAILQARKGQLA